MKKYFQKSAQIALILVYLVIIAGALVRMTGSGMGCPDWPKCFGYYIPPTEISQLTWSENHEFEKGQVIIKDEILLVANSNFTSKTTFEPSYWEKYTKHDYAIFNPFHTWVEYINRLLGASAGIACLILFFISFWYFKENKKLVFLSFFVCFLMGFQAWLGKTVVDSVLSPLKITTHMIVALLIVALILYIINYSKRSKTFQFYNSKFHKLLLSALFISVIQIIMGTQVRQHIDNEVKNGVTASIIWLQNPTFIFYIHRSFSILVLLINSYLFFINKKMKLGFSKINIVLLLVCLEIFTGILMYYFDFPIASQPLHLTIASLLFGVQFYLILESKLAKE